MKYYSNNLGAPIFLSDIRKAIDYDPEFPDRPTRLAYSDVERSSQLKQYLVDRLILDVTEEVVSGQQQPQQYNEVVVQQPQQVGQSQYVGGEARPRPQTMPRTERIMVDEAEGSRITGASDAHLHTAHLNRGIRHGAETGILTDGYDTPEQRDAVNRSRSSFLVENDSRATPAVDPRMLRHNQTQMNPVTSSRYREQAPVPHVPAPGQVNGGSSNVQQGPPLAQLYQTRPVAQRMVSYQTHEHGHAHKNDPNWGQHSQLLAQRRAANPIQARAHDHAFANHHSEPLDPRMAANQQRVFDPGLNPALAGVQGGPVADPNLNPLFSFVAPVAPAPSQQTLTSQPEIVSYEQPAPAFNPLLSPIVKAEAATEVEEPEINVTEIEVEVETTEGETEETTEVNVVTVSETTEEPVLVTAGASEAKARRTTSRPKVTTSKRGAKKK